MDCTSADMATDVCNQSAVSTNVEECEVEEVTVTTSVSDCRSDSETPGVSGSANDVVLQKCETVSTSYGEHRGDGDGGDGKSGENSGSCVGKSSGSGADDGIDGKVVDCSGDERVTPRRRSLKRPLVVGEDFVAGGGGDSGSDVDEIAYDSDDNDPTYVPENISNKKIESQKLINLGHQKGLVGALTVTGKDGVVMLKCTHCNYSTSKSSSASPMYKHITRRHKDLKLVKLSDKVGMLALSQLAVHRGSEEFVDGQEASLEDDVECLESSNVRHKTPSKQKCQRRKVSKDDADMNKYVCPQCNFKASGRREMYFHLRQKHMLWNQHSDQSPDVLNLAKKELMTCGGREWEIEKVENHPLGHTFKCPLCWLTSKLPSTIYTHFSKLHRDGMPGQEGISQSGTVKSFVGDASGASIGKKDKESHLTDQRSVQSTQPAENDTLIKSESCKDLTVQDESSGYDVNLQFSTDVSCKAAAPVPIPSMEDQKTNSLRSDSEAERILLQLMNTENEGEAASVTIVAGDDAVASGTVDESATANQNTATAIEIPITNEGHRYQCSLCFYTSPGTGPIYKHIERKHSSYEIRKRMSMTSVEPSPSTKTASAIDIPQTVSGHRYQCSLCTYTSAYTGTIYKHIHRKHASHSILKRYDTLKDMKVVSADNTKTSKKNESASKIAYVVEIPLTQNQMCFQCSVCTFTAKEFDNVCTHICSKHPTHHLDKSYAEGKSDEMSASNNALECASVDSENDVRTDMSNDEHSEKNNEFQHSQDSRKLKVSAQTELAFAMDGPCTNKNDRYQCSVCNYKSENTSRIYKHIANKHQSHTVKRRGELKSAMKLRKASKKVGSKPALKKCSKAQRIGGISDVSAKSKSKKNTGTEVSNSRGSESRNFLESQRPTSPLTDNDSVAMGSENESDGAESNFHSSVGDRDVLVSHHDETSLLSDDDALPESDNDIVDSNLKFAFVVDIPWTDEGHRYKCSVCNYTSAYTSAIYKHIPRNHPCHTAQKRAKSSHLAAFALDIPPSEEGHCYLCSVCTFTADQLQDIYNHIHSTHPSYTLQKQVKIKKKRKHNRPQAPALNDTEEGLSGVFENKNVGRRTSNGQCIESENDLEFHDPRENEVDAGSKFAFVVAGPCTDKYDRYECSLCDFTSHSTKVIYKHIKKNHQSYTIRSDGKIETVSKDIRRKSHSQSQDNTSNLETNHDPREKNGTGTKFAFAVDGPKTDIFDRYQCSVCNYKSDNTSSVYKHIVHRHKTYTVKKRGQLKSEVKLKRVLKEVGSKPDSHNLKKHSKAQQIAEMSDLNDSLDVDGTDDLELAPRDHEIDTRPKFAFAEEGPNTDKNDRYQCSVCDYKSNFSSSIYKHIIRCHPSYTVKKREQLKREMTLMSIYKDFRKHPVDNIQDDAHDADESDNDASTCLESAYGEGNSFTDVLQRIMTEKKEKMRYLGLEHTSQSVEIYSTDYPSQNEYQTVSIRKCTGAQMYKCSKCDFSNNRAARIYAHMKQKHHGMIRIVLKDLDALRRFSFSVTVEKLDCNRCEPFFSTSHIASCQAVSNIAPGNLDDTLPELSSRMTENNIVTAIFIPPNKHHHSVQCSQCSGTFFSLPALYCHMEEEHSDLRLVPVSHPAYGEALTVVRKGMRRKEGLIEPQSEDWCGDGSQFVIPLPLPHSKEGFKSFRCSICPKSTDELGKLYSHMLEKHPHHRIIALTDKRYLSAIKALLANSSLDTKLDNFLEKTGKKAKISVIEFTSPDEPFKFGCPMCDKKGNKRLLIYKHILRTHPDQFPTEKGSKGLLIQKNSSAPELKSREMSLGPDGDNNEAQSNIDDFNEAQSDIGDDEPPSDIGDNEDSQSNIGDNKTRHQKGLVGALTVTGKDGVVMLKCTQCNYSTLKSSSASPMYKHITRRHKHLKLVKLGDKEGMLALSQLAMHTGSDEFMDGQEASLEDDVEYLDKSKTQSAQSNIGGNNEARSNIGDDETQSNIDVNNIDDNDDDDDETNKGAEGIVNKQEFVFFECSVCMVMFSTLEELDQHAPLCQGDGSEDGLEDGFDWEGESAWESEDETMDSLHDDSSQKTVEAKKRYIIKNSKKQLVYECSECRFRHHRLEVLYQHMPKQHKGCLVIMGSRKTESLYEFRGKTLPAEKLHLYFEKQFVTAAVIKHEKLGLMHQCSQCRLVFKTCDLAYSHMRNAHPDMIIFLKSNLEKGSNDGKNTRQERGGKGSRRVSSRGKKSMSEASVENFCDSDVEDDNEAESTTTRTGGHDLLIDTIVCEAGSLKHEFVGKLVSKPKHSSLIVKCVSVKDSLNNQLYQCSACQKVLPHSSGMYKHIKVRHADMVLEKVKDSKSKEILPDKVLDMLTRWNHGDSIHQMLLSTLGTLVRVTGLPNDVSVHPWKCSVCNVTVEELDDLFQHMKEQHHSFLCVRKSELWDSVINGREAPSNMEDYAKAAVRLVVFQCFKCHRTFLTPGDLEDHFVVYGFRNKNNDNNGPKKLDLWDMYGEASGNVSNVSQNVGKSSSINVVFEALPHPEANLPPPQSQPLSFPSQRTNPILIAEDNNSVTRPGKTVFCTAVPNTVAEIARGKKRFECSVCKEYSQDESSYIYKHQQKKHPDHTIIRLSDFDNFGYSAGNHTNGNSTLPVPDDKTVRILNNPGDPNGRIFKCSKCNLTAAKRASLYRHMMKRHGSLHIVKKDRSSNFLKSGAQLSANDDYHEKVKSLLASANAIENDVNGDNNDETCDYDNIDIGDEVEEYSGDNADYLADEVSCQSSWNAETKEGHQSSYLSNDKNSRDKHKSNPQESESLRERGKEVNVVDIPRNSLGHNLKCSSCEYTGDSLGSMYRHFNTVHPECVAPDSWNDPRSLGSKSDSGNVDENGSVTILEMPEESCFKFMCSHCKLPGNSCESLYKHMSQRHPKLKLVKRHDLVLKRGGGGRLEVTYATLKKLQALIPKHLGCCALAVDIPTTIKGHKVMCSVCGVTAAHATSINVHMLQTHNRYKIVKKADVALVEKEYLRIKNSFPAMDEMETDILQVQQVHDERLRKFCFNDGDKGGTSGKAADANSNHPPQTRPTPSSSNAFADLNNQVNGAVITIANEGNVLGANDAGPCESNASGISLPDQSVYAYPKASTPVELSKGARLYSCSVCGQSFDSCHRIYRHIRGSHPDRKMLKMHQLETNGILKEKDYSSVNTPMASDTEAGGPSSELWVQGPSPEPSGDVVLETIHSQLKGKRFECSQCKAVCNSSLAIFKHAQEMHQGDIVKVTILDPDQIADTLQSWTPNVSGNLTADYPASGALSAGGNAVAESITKETIEALIKTSNSEAILQGHPVFTCKVCGLTSDYRLNMDSHIQRMHSSNLIGQDPCSSNGSAAAKRKASNSASTPRKRRKSNPGTSKLFDALQTLTSSTTTNPGVSGAAAIPVDIHYVGAPTQPEETVSIIKATPREIRQGVSRYRCSMCGYVGDSATVMYKHMNERHSGYDICRVGWGVGNKGSPAFLAGKASVLARQGTNTS